MVRCDANQRFDTGLQLDTPDDSAAGLIAMKIKQGLRGLDEMGQVNKVRQWVTGMTGNAHFAAPNPAPTPPLADVTQLADDAETAINNYNNAVTFCAMRLAEKRAALKALRQAAPPLQGYVQSVAGNDPTIVLSANMEIVPMAPPVGELVAPEKLVVKTNGLEGVIRLNWPRVRGTRNYAVERTTNPNDSATWEQIAMPPRASYVDEGLTSGTKYWYRVAANGAAGLGPWSNVASKVAA